MASLEPEQPPSHSAESCKMAAKNMLISFAFLLFTAITAVTFRFFNSIQADPYMDEIFHIPQAQNYCVGNLGHWNNKITTLPGLYVVSLIGLKVRKFMPFIGKEDEEDPCSVLFLRFGNLLFMLANLWLLYEISVVINSNVSHLFSIFDLS